jgi:hypothetical protein
MENKSNFKLAISIVMVVLLIAGCSTSNVGATSDNENQSPNSGIAVTGVTVSDTQIAFHGKSTLPDGACINTKLLADGTPLPWWPSDSCVDQQQNTWELKVPLGDNKLQADVQYVLNAYQRDDQNVATTFAFDLSGPPMPSE